MPTYQTEILEAVLIDPNQTGSKETHNDGLDQLANAQGKVLEIDLTSESSPYTIPYSSLEGGDKTGLQFRILRLIGTPAGAFQVIVPDREHEFIVHNNCGQNVTVRTSGGTGPTLADDELSDVYCDSVNVTSIVSSADTPNTTTDYEESVRIATDATEGNITLSGEQTIQSVPLVANDRVLLTAQTAGADNRIWIVSTGAWTIATGWNVSDTVTSGKVIPIEEGDNAGKIARLITPDPIVLGTTVLSWDLENEVFTANFISRNVSGASVTLNVTFARNWAMLVRNGDQTATVPTNASHPHSINTEIVIQAYGTGIKTISWGASVTVNGVSNSSYVLLGGKDAILLKKRQTNNWTLTVLSGALSAAAERIRLGLVIGTDVQAYDAELAQIAALPDPEADRVLFWDDSLGEYTHLTMGTNLSITGTTLNASASGATLADGDYGDIIASSNGTVLTIDNDVVTYAKMQNVSATDKLLGRSTAGAGDVEEIPCTAFARGILDDANEAAFKATVNLEIGVDVEAFDPDILRADVTDNLVVGFTSTAFNAGTKSSGTFTPNPANGNFQRAVNGGAHALDPPSVGGGDSVTMVLQYTNNVSAGAITTSNFNKVIGSFTTTDGDDFFCLITVSNGFSSLTVINLSVTDVADGVGKHTIWVPASAMIAATTSGPATAQVELATNKQNVAVLDFDASADEYVHFQVAFPKSWNLGTVTFRVFWTTSATDSDGVAWALEAVARSDNEGIDNAWGTAVVITDDAQAGANEQLVTAESGAVTIGGSPADDDLVYFRLFRDVSDGNDDMAEDARLIGIKLFYTTDAVTDD